MTFDCDNSGNNKMLTTTLLKIKKKRKKVWINPSLPGRKEAFPAWLMSTIPLFMIVVCRYKGKQHSRKAVPRFWLWLFELVETNHWEGLILWHQLQCRWKKGELWHVCSLKSGSMLWIPPWWLQEGKNTLWVCLLSEIHAVNPAAEFNFYDAKETCKARLL